MENAKEVEVDGVSDGSDILIGAIIEHVEFAGTHSGDATMVIPPQTLSPEVVSKIQVFTNLIARVLNIRGTFNIQFLVKDEEIYVIECNLRASRSIPYTSKATGIPLIWIGAKVMLGKTLRELNCLKRPKTMHVAVKAPTFSFMRLKGADPVLGVEMTSTGEVACLDYAFAGAYIKALTASGLDLPKPDKPILLTVKEEDKETVVEIAEKLRGLGYPIFATRGTAQALRESGLETDRVLRKVSESRNGKSILASLARREIGLVINTPTVVKEYSLDDGFAIRRVAIEFLVPVLTRIETAKALVDALAQNGYNPVIHVRPLNEFIGSTPFSRHV